MLKGKHSIFIKICKYYKKLKINFKYIDYYSFKLI